MDDILTHGRWVVLAPDGGTLCGENSLGAELAWPDEPRLLVDLGRADADIADPDTYVDGVPHATFQRLRDDDPVSWWDEDHAGGRGFWAVTRYADLLHVSRERRHVLQRQGITPRGDGRRGVRGPAQHAGVDPPEHTRYRRLVSKPFSRREVYAYENAIRPLARTVVDEALGAGATSTSSSASPSSCRCACSGACSACPTTTVPWLVERGDALLGNFDPEFTTTPSGSIDTDEFKSIPFRIPAALDLYRYAEEQAEQRREHPTDDVISDLLAPTIDGDRLTEHEFKNFFIAARQRRQRHHALHDGGRDQGADRASRPARRAARRGASPATATSSTRAVEEILRWGTVTMHFRRTATADTELGGRQIRRGDKVVIWFMSADYDERQFRRSVSRSTSTAPPTTTSPSGG